MHIFMRLNVLDIDKNQIINKDPLRKKRNINKNKT